MKNYLSLPLLILLTGCVTYYQPQTALEDGVYYADDDPRYVVYQGPYAGGVYYPWVSLDYFYLGFDPYPRYPYFYGFPFGLMYDYAYRDYAYWFYPYPGYSGWGGYYAYWNGHGMSGHGRNRHAGDPHGGNRNRNDDETDNEESPADDPEDPRNRSNIHGAPYGQYVSAQPSGYSGNRGMVIRSNEAKKVGKSRVQPSDVTPSSNGIVTAAPPAQTTVVSGSNASGEPSRPSSPSASRPPSASMPANPSMSSNQVRSDPRPSNPGSSGPRPSSPRSSSPRSPSPHSPSPHSSGPGAPKNSNPHNESR